ncbi:MAG TPA: UDP-galactopyranose mutase [Anaeromyxobacter sp.]|jgi:UDP-galactopyranose mutase|nr:UDP-galactopyranose mutase [Anaeromyxobacter sp.]
MRFDWVVVGAGFTGATFARAAADRGRRVLVVESRLHLGGNSYDEQDERGVLVHAYGPHIFHTNDGRVWSFLSAFTEWRPYMHRVLALIDGSWAPLPFNLNSIERLLPRKLADDLASKLVATFGYGARVPILELRETDDAQLRFLADYVYQRVFLSYTRKQWGVAPDQLDPQVTARVPVLVSRDDRYFQDTHQAMPARGYAPLFRRMLDHPNIQVLLGARHSDVLGEVPSARVLFTGPIDAFFGHRLGVLPYRSIRFEFRGANVDRYQEVAVHNYPETEAFTRITECKQLSGQVIPGLTTLCTEYPQDHVHGVTEAYYPVPRAESRELYARYAALAKAEAPGVVFAGRLGEFQYLNMDQAVARGLALAEAA